MEHLAMAERHVTVEHHIERQRRVLAERRRQGLDSHEAMELLMRFERLQAMHGARRDRLRKELGLYATRSARGNS